MSQGAAGWTTGVGEVAMSIGVVLALAAVGVAGHPAPLLWAALLSILFGMVAIGVDDLLLAAKPQPVLGLPDVDGVWTHQQVLDWLPVSADVRATLGRGEGR